MLEEPRPVGPFHHGPVLLLGEARGNEVLRRACLVDGGDGAEAGAGQRPGALDHLAEHRLEVEACADPQARRAVRPERSPPRPGGGRIGVPGPGAGSAGGWTGPGRFGGPGGEIPVEFTVTILHLGNYSHSFHIRSGRITSNPCRRGDGAGARREPLCLSARWVDDSESVSRPWNSCRPRQDPISGANPPQAGSRDRGRYLLEAVQP